MGNIRSLQRRRQAAFASSTSLLLPPTRPFASPVPVSSPLSGDQVIDQEHTKRIGWSLERIAVTSEDLPSEHRDIVNPVQGQTAVSSSEHMLQLKAVEPGVHKENTTGLPDDLKAGVENLSGLSLDDVHVSYNSSKPAEVQALAYTQGTEIHVGSGQERHLAHEAWHVVQQKQGRVQPTTHVGETRINDDITLEQEADGMGLRANQLGPNILQKRAIQPVWPGSYQTTQSGAFPASLSSIRRSQGVLQRVYNAEKIHHIELERLITEHWGNVNVNVEARADDLIGWCNWHSQAQAIVQNYSFDKYQEIKVTVAKKFHTSKSLGKNIDTIRAAIKGLEDDTILPKSPDEAFEEAASEDKIRVLGRLLNAGMIGLGGFDGDAYRTQFDDAGRNEFSVAVTITGMNRYVIHAHCNADGTPKTTGNRPVSIKEQSNARSLGATLFPPNAWRNKLLPDAAKCLGHARAALLVL